MSKTVTKLGLSFYLGQKKNKKNQHVLFTLATKKVHQVLKNVGKVYGLPKYPSGVCF